MDWILGVQGNSVSEQMKQDLHGTIKRIRELGFDAIEPCLRPNAEQGRIGVSQWSIALAEEMCKEARELGLAIPSAHVMVNPFMMERSAGKLIPVLTQFHKRTGIDTYIFSGMFNSVRSARRWGRILNAVAEGVKGESIKVLYHNHDGEFKRVSVDDKSVYAMDVFCQYAGPHVGLELDIGWAGFADDEIGIARRYADRIVEIHCKDFRQEALDGRYNRMNVPKGMFAAIGTGGIRTEEILKMTPEFPAFNGAVIIDQDHSVNGIWQDLVTGHERLMAFTGAGMQ